MAMWMVDYTYNDQHQARDQHRPAHRAFLAALVDTGQMLAYGRFDDDGPAGALLIVEAPSAVAVADLLADDPFAREGLISDTRVRRWAGVWGAVPRSD
ncbi:MAG: YciI family protein [Demequina sp.]